MAQPSQDAQEICRSLAASSNVKAYFQNTSEYQLAQDSYFSLQEEELRPTCILKPTTTEQVSLSVRTLVEKKVPFAVRGGGHTLNAGSANIESGVTINLRALNNVSTDTGRNIVSIGGGAKWGEVYPHLDALGLATSGGRVADVGVGGLTTGGGISFFSAREGLVCDNVVNFEVVLATGEVINVNKSDHTDLFVALKGGSSNFGIVTRFDLSTFPQSSFYGGVIVYPIDTVQAQLKALSDLDANFDPYAALIMSISYSQANGSYSIFNNIEYTKGGENPEGMQALTSIQPQYMNTMRVSNLSDFATEAAKFAGPGRRNQFATTTFGGGLEALQQVYNLWNQSVPSISSIAGITWAITLQPFPPAYSAESEQKGGNSLGLDPSQGPLILFLLSYNWNNESDDDLVTSRAQELIDKIDEAMKNRGVYSEFKYLNYAASWQNPLAGYGQSNVKNLKAVSQKYDPRGAFQTLCPGGFKITQAGVELKVL